MKAWSADQRAKIRAHPLSKHADKCVKGTLKQKSHQLCVSPAVFTHPHKFASLIPQNTQQASHQCIIESVLFYLSNAQKQNKN